MASEIRNECMKIMEFNTECIEEKSRLGLQSFKMSKLNNVVLLAGKNGSGKTRILRLLQNQANNKQSFYSEKNILKHNVLQIDSEIESCQK